MKKLIIFGVFFTLIFLTSCANYKTKKEQAAHERKMELSQTEFEKYRVESDTIYYSEEAVAAVTNVEWEYIPGEDMRMEISVTLVNKFDDSKISGIIKFIHMKHKEAKIEVNFD
jgi:hypothetical protein